MKSQIFWPQAGMLRDPDHHVWTNLVCIVESEDVIRPAFPLQNSV